MIEEFLRYCRAELQLSPLTVEAYSVDLKQWRDFATSGGRHELAPETTALSDLRLWIASVARGGASARTIRRKIQSLRAFFRFMMKRHGLADNPAMDLAVPRLSRDLPVYVRTEEMQSMLNTEIDESDFNEVRNRLILEMFYETGLRCSELVGLLDSNVDEARGELKVHGKRNKDRIVPFGAELSDLIRAYRTMRSEQIPGLATHEFFVRKSGQPLYRRLVYNIVHEAMESGGIHAGRKSPHVMRHSFATDMLNGGAQLTSVQQLLGHQSLTATQVYTHISYRDLKQNYQLAHPRAQKKGG